MILKNLIIERSAIRNNIRTIKDFAGGCTVYADLSADAYGLGLLETARILRDEGIRNFAVSDPADAEALRKNGFVDETVMMLRSTADAEELSKLIDLGVICTVGSYDAAVAINGLAEARKTVCEIQIKVDTGLGRYGFSPTETDKIIALYKYMPNLAIVGIFTTLNESIFPKKLQAQLEEFDRVIEWLHDMGFETGIIHACSSSTIFSKIPYKYDAVRVDIAIAGRVHAQKAPSLEKVGYIEASIEEIGWFPKGHRISGGKKLKKAARLATLSAGYHHGFGELGLSERNSLVKKISFMLKRKTYVKIGGHKAKVCGKIGLMHTLIDVTNIKCAIGDIVVMEVDPINASGLTVVYR